LGQKGDFQGNPFQYCCDIQGAERAKKAAAFLKKKDQVKKKCAVHRKYWLFMDILTLSLYFVGPIEPHPTIA